MDGVSVSPAASCEGSEGQSPEASSDSEFVRCVCSESSSFIMAQPTLRGEAPSRLWITTVFIIMAVLQVASTTGLFLYLNMSMAQVTELPLTLAVYEL